MASGTAPASTSTIFPRNSPAAQPLGDFEQGRPAISGSLGRASGDKTGTDEIIEMLKQPGMMNFNPAPQGLMKQAAHMYKVGTLPKVWTDTFLPIAHDLPGN